MKNVLFISISNYDLDSANPHLAKKFEGLSRYVNIFLIGRGKFSRAHMWGSNFFLLPKAIYLPAGIVLASYLCLFKKIDAIVCQGPLTEGLIGVFLKFIFRKELIIEIHGDWREGPFLNKKRLFNPLLRMMVPMAGSLSLSCADKIRTLTCIARNEIRLQFPGKKYFVFPTFTDIDMFLAEKNTNHENYICTAAVLSPIKNIETLIEAFVKIHNKFPEFKLTIIGDGPSRDELKAISYKLKADGRIVFTGKLSQEEVKNVIKNCFMFVLPSLSEGFGRVFIEAMALGKPVIGSKVGGVPEIIKDGSNGFLIEPKDVEGLAGKIEYLINNPEIARHMGEAGQKFVRENFSNEKYVKKYINMLNS